MSESHSFLPPPRTSVGRFQPVLAAWSELALAGHVHFDDDGVSDEEFEALTRATGGGRVPRELRALYEISRSGFEIEDGSVCINPWPPQEATEYGVEQQADFLLPDQMYVFGDDTGENVWTYWLQRGGSPESPPVLVILEYDVYSIYSAGTLTEFLKFETAISLLVMGDDPAVEAAADALGLPHDLRHGSIEDSALLRRLAHWAEPMAARYDYPEYLAREPLEADQLTGLARDLP